MQRLIMLGRTFLHSTGTDTGMETNTGVSLVAQISRETGRGTSVQAQASLLNSYSSILVRPSESTQQEILLIGPSFLHHLWINYSNSCAMLRTQVDQGQHLD